MTFLKSDRLRRALLLVAFLMLACMLFSLHASAELTCGHDAGVDNGFCTELECGIGYEKPMLNEGEENNPADDVYEIENAGQLYWFFQHAMTKAEGVTVRAKLVAHIVVNPDLLDDAGNVNAFYTEVENGELVNEPYHWMPKNIVNVVFDGDGYTVSGLYAVRYDNFPTGFFSTAKNVTVKNLGILDSYFSSGTAYTGALFGEALNACTAENCFVLDCAFTGDKAAGLIGRYGYAGQSGLMWNCYTNAASAIYEYDAENDVRKCYYVAQSDVDAITGTENVSLEDAKGGALLQNLKENNVHATWQVSCRRGFPVLRGEHKYAFACQADCDNFAVCAHSRVDGEEGKIAHTYDNECDYTCNRCERENKERKEKKDNHYYKAACDTDCDECGFVREDAEDHKYSHDCDKYCNYCAFQRTPPVANHQYDYACEQYCKICHHDRGDAAAAHTFDNKCDMICNVCAVTRAGDHTYDNACDPECNDCKFVRTITHAFGDYVVVQQPTHFKEGVKERECSVCGYKESAAIEVLAGWPLWLILSVSIGGGVAVLIGGFALYWFVLKKRSFAQLIGRSPEQLKEKERKQRKEQRRLEKEEKKKAEAQANDVAEQSVDEDANNEK